MAPAAVLSSPGNRRPPALWDGVIRGRRALDFQNAAAPDTGSPGLPPRGPPAAGLRVAAPGPSPTLQPLPHPPAHPGPCPPPRDCCLMLALSPPPEGDPRAQGNRASAWDRTGVLCLRGTDQNSPRAPVLDGGAEGSRRSRGLWPGPYRCESSCTADLTPQPAQRERRNEVPEPVSRMTLSVSMSMAAHGRQVCLSR